MYLKNFKKLFGCKVDTGSIEGVCVCVCVCKYLKTSVRPGTQSEDQNQFFTFKVRTFLQSEVKFQSSLCD